MVLMPLFEEEFCRDLYRKKKRKKKSKSQPNEKKSKTPFRTSRKKPTGPIQNHPPRVSQPHFQAEDYCHSRTKKQHNPRHANPGYPYHYRSTVHRFAFDSSCSSSSGVASKNRWDQPWRCQPPPRTATWAFRRWSRSTNVHCSVQNCPWYPGQPEWSGCD